MKFSKIASLVSVIVISTLIFTGCKIENDEEGDLKNVDLPEKMGWEYIKDKGEIIVGLDDTFAPMGYRDEKGELVGFDIDLAKETAKELGVELKFKSIDWNTKEIELMSKNIDCIWNGMSATEERQKKMALTKKYLNNKIIILTRDKSVKIDNNDDISKYKIGTQSDSAALEAMMNNEKYSEFKENIKEYTTYDLALMDLKTGRLDCIVVDQVLGEYKNSKLEEKLPVANFDFGNDFYAIGCRIGEEDLANKINESLQKIIDNGKAEEISTKWFGKNIVILEDYK